MPTGVGRGLQSKHRLCPQGVHGRGGIHGDKGNKGELSVSNTADGPRVCPSSLSFSWSPECDVSLI